MPNLRIKNITPNITARNLTANIRVRPNLPNAVIRNLVSQIRIRAGGSVSVTGTASATFGGKGYPIGVLLSVTDIKSHTITGSQIISISDFKPNIRIRSN